jgi:hypothetical protein
MSIPSSEQVEVVQLVAILKDVPLNLGRVNPCDKVFHGSIQVSHDDENLDRAVYLVTRKAGSVMISVPTTVFSFYASFLTVEALLLTLHVSLLNERSDGGKILSHAQSLHNHRQSSTSKTGDGHLVLDIWRGSMIRVRRQDGESRTA